jgi:hypothetical protein
MRALCLTLHDDSVYRLYIKSKWIRQCRWDIVATGINVSPYAVRLGKQVGNRLDKANFIGLCFSYEFQRGRHWIDDERLIQYTVNFKKQTIISVMLERSLLD